MIKTVKNYLLIAAGFLSLALGIIGIITPVLPTTPFLLLSSYCFVRSSGKLNNWLLHHRIFGKYIANYLKYHAITRKVKITAIAFLWISLTLSIYLIHNIWAGLMLAVIGIAVSVHILLIKTLNPDELK